MNEQEHMETSSSDDDEEFKVVVIDNGSGTFKAGFAGDGSPQCIIRPNAVGRRRSLVLSLSLSLSLSFSLSLKDRISNQYKQRTPFSSMALEGRTCQQS